LQKYLFIATGGALGSLARYGVGSLVAGRMGTRFPYGTFVINLTACVIIGFSLTLMERRTEINPAWRFLIPIGFLITALYVSLSVLLGLLAVWLGVVLARLAF
jgi:CrcB protein